VIHRIQGLSIQPAALSWALALAFTATASAAPTGAAVSAGQAQVSQAGNLTRVMQQSERAVIDWRSFGLGAREAVEFQQPSAGAVTLNRVLGGDASAILGRITANGSVFLVNPNGILFGEDAQINVGGLVASTANISSANFMAGRYRFDEPGQAGARIDQRGTVRIADQGIAALVGRQVTNSGFIVARLGRVALAGGDTFVLDLAGDRLISLILDPAALETVRDAQGRPLAARVGNTGNILANGGRIEFSADTVSRLLDNVINLQGDVRATAVDSRDGVILLRGGPSTDLTLGGVLQAGGRDGRVDAAGRDVTLAAGAQLDLGLGAGVTLIATRDLALAAPVNALGAGSVAGGSLNASAGGKLGVAQSLVLNDAKLQLSAGGRLDVAGGAVLQSGSQGIGLRGAAGVAVGQLLGAGAIEIDSSAGAVEVAAAIVAPSAGAQAAPVSRLTVHGQRGVTLNGALATGDIVVTSGADMALQGTSIDSRAGHVQLQAAGRVAAAPGVGVLAGGGNLAVSAGAALELQAALARGDTVLAAGGTLGVAQPMANPSGAAGDESRSITLDGGGDVTLAGARAAAISITSRGGSVTSSADGGLVSSGGVRVAALGGRAGSAAAPLRIAAGDGTGAAGISGGARIQGRDGVDIATLVTPGAVWLRSDQGAVAVGTAIAGSAGSALADAAPTRELRVEAAGGVALAGARTGPGGIGVSGATAGQGAGGFALAGGALLSDGDVTVTSRGPIDLGALVQAGGSVELQSTAGELRVGEAGIRSTGAGRSITLGAGADVQLNGDLQAEAATIAITSTGGRVAARVGTPGFNPATADATLDAGSGAAAQVRVQAQGDIMLGGVRAGGSVTLASSGGNVLLLSPLGGQGTGYDQYALGYQASLRPDVGSLSISAPNGSVELNGLNLDGLADPRAAGNGLSVTAGRLILSNATIAVNKGDIVLQGGSTQASDGVYLGSSVFSRGWDSVGSDGARGGVAAAADEKLGYGIRIGGRNLGLFDNNTDVAELPGLFTVRLSNGSRARTDAQAYLVDVNGVRDGPNLQRVIKDDPNVLATLTDIHIAAAPDASDDAKAVLGQPVARVVGKVEIANNVANYRDADRDALVPATSATPPTLLIDVGTVAGVVGNPASGGANAIGRQSLARFSPVLGGLGETPIVARAADQKVASTKGMALKLLAFADAQDLSTEVWNTLVAFTAVPGALDPTRPSSFSSAFGGEGLSPDTFTVNPANPLLGGLATLPVGGRFSLTVLGNFQRGADVCDPCLATYQLQRLAGELGAFARIQSIDIAGQPASAQNWLPGGNAASALQVNSMLQIRFGNDPVVGGPILGAGADVDGSARLATGGTARGAEVRGSLLSAIGSAFGGRLGVANVFSPTEPQLVRLPTLSQDAAGGLSSRSSANPAFPLGYQLGRVVVDSSTTGTYDLNTQRGTRIEIFDGVLYTQLGRVSGDATGAANFIPGFGGIPLGKNNSTTGFASVGAGVGRSSGSSGQAAVGSAAARAVGGVAAAAAGVAPGAAPGAPVDPGFVLLVPAADRSTQDASAGAAAGAPARDADDAQAGVQFAKGPAAQADLGRSGALAGSATNVFKLSYRLAVDGDAVACAPDAIEPKRRGANANKAAATSAAGAERACGPAAR